MKTRLFFAAATLVFASGFLVIGITASSAQFLGRVDEDPNSFPNTYGPATSFLKLPAGRTMGSSTGVAGDSQGHLWVLDRCGANGCEGSKLDPIMEFDANGTFIKAFGGGMMNFPHGLFIGRDDHIWVTDGRGTPGKGHVVMEFDQNGKLLRTLGKPGVVGDDPGIFDEPNAVLVAPDGSIFVADGHRPNVGSARITKFDAKGKFIKQWGGHGDGLGVFNVPHALAMDSKGMLYVADRWNNRIEIFDQTGTLHDVWTQFGRPSGIYIDKKDNIYVSDSESREPVSSGYHPGWKRGIRIGSVKDGIVRTFIPDTYESPDRVSTSGAEGIWADDKGVVYGAQVREKSVVKYTPR